MQPRSHEKLVVWKEAYALCLSVYRTTSAFPSYERLGLMAQMRRAASNVPISIAEGNTRRSGPEKISFLESAGASLEALHCVSALSRDLEYISKEKCTSIERRIHKVSFLLSRLKAALAK